MRDEPVAGDDPVDAGAQPVEIPPVDGEPGDHGRDLPTAGRRPPAARMMPGARLVPAAGNPPEDDLPSAGRRPADARESPGRVTVEAAEGGVDDSAVPEVDDSAVPEAEDAAVREGEPQPSAWRKLSASTSGPMIWILLALFGFSLVAQLRTNNEDQGLAGARQEDLVRILSDLDARDSRLQTEISNLEESQRQLTSGVAGRQAALDEAAKRADELGLLAGTLRGRGPGLVIVMSKVKASAVLNCVQELRGSGGEVIQIAGQDGTAVRIVASSYFVDAGGGGILVDGAHLAGPYTLSVIGPPQTMQPALQIAGGVVTSVNGSGGSVTMEPRSLVEVTAVRKTPALQFARPVS
jgi:uncharacterized protein YlxW (UPF0749 family)